MIDDLANDMRRVILEQSWRAEVGHIGSCLSVVDMVAALFYAGLHTPPTDDESRGRLVMSKGHAGLALYAALNLTGRISDETLDTFCADGSLLGVHPEVALDGIDFSTGSLGQGLSFGVGSALAARMAGVRRRTAVLMSDAECNEGSVWEAAAFAAHHGLGDLVALIDCNGQQALGQTADILDMSPLADRWAAFGWDVHEVDGHDSEAMSRLLDTFEHQPGTRPHVLVANTVFGHGVSFMERQVRWHYMPMSRQEFDLAMTEVAGRTG